ncbi:MAG: PAS domain-containing sensor histidine kinase [Synergistota bacterium]|nr:PAS domain-containing sensor histidine kinase [Synergistota bacterium]
MKRQEKGLDELSYRIFFERTFDPISLYEVEAGKVRFIDVNPAYEEVMGTPKEDIVGRTFLEVWPDVEPCWHDIIMECLNTEGSVHCESYCASIGKYLEAIAFPILPDRVSVIFLDRTRWKKSDEKLREKQKELLDYREELRELAAQLTLSEEKTRRSIAGQIHDSIGHSLVTLLHKLQSLRERRCSKEELDDAIESVETVIAQSRELIFQVSPPTLYDIGLNPALESLAEHLLAPQGISYDFQGGNLVHQADDRICVLLYQMTRELLINVIKHAKASHVSIRVHRGPGKIQVVVEDDGIGFPSPFTFKWGKLDGFGLFSIRERLHPIGGSIQIISEPGNGATVAMTAPLNMPSHEERGEPLDTAHNS